MAEYITKRLHSVPKDQRQLGHAGWRNVIHYIGPKKRILAGGTESEGQREYDIFHWPRDVAVRCYAPRTL